MNQRSDATRIRILVGGAGLRGSGYPNAWNTIRILKGIDGVAIVECGTWLPEGFQLWRLSKGPRWKAAIQLGRLLSANVLSAVLLVLRARSGSLAYIPYPSVFLLWLLSWLPARLRPRCICDAYITVWDTLYQDRRMGDAQAPVARLLLRFESRALRAAEVVLVDTEANAEHVSQLFDVPRGRVRPIPLAIGESKQSLPVTVRRTKNAIRVLFIGTFVPLQGTTLIAQAINALRGRSDLEFVLIGDGQQAEEAARLLNGHPAVTWLRGWQPAHVLAEYLAEADISLGVFGGNDKAGRVLPFKIYLALAAGKAIITQDAYGTPGTPAIPARTIPSTVDALTAAILDLAQHADRRVRLGHAAGSYYCEHLSDAAIAGAWRELLRLGSEQ